MRSRILLVLVALGFIVATSPLLIDASPPATAQSTSVAQVDVVDLAGELSPGDVDLLTSQTPTIPLPADVTTVNYLLFATNDDNLNDTVLDYAKQDRPDLISADGDKWAPGHLLVAVGLDPKRMGVYCGDDVCASIGLYESGRLDGILDRMEPPLKDGNWAAGLLQGAMAAADPTATRNNGGGGSGDNTGLYLAAGLTGLGGVAAVGLGGAMVARSRKNKAATARSQFDDLQRNYGRVAQELPAIDVRATSLTSPLANDALRRQWAEVRDGFLAIHSDMDALGELSASSDDKRFRSHAARISSAHEKLTRLTTAEENIEMLASMEHGDASVRRRELSTLHEDILEALAAEPESDLVPQLEELGRDVVALRSDLEAPSFMDRFADLLTRHRVLVEAATKRLYDASDVEASDEHHAPALWESTWRPGYGFQGYVPFAITSAWHHQDVEAHAAAASSSSATTGYSSPGFSGGGGSRGF
ncbi:DUF5129 domain-containing protein [Corynebacterium atrinae]|uniref:DUF5129 domain-containing protein n=1 Tax=Corynebacterium atrinae TaxID=1336740 RepID=UPI0025B4B174|nr:DUF5129 domain-containing protein [Corynebacterium atrinae]